MKSKSNPHLNRIALLIISIIVSVSALEIKADTIDWEIIQQDTSSQETITAVPVLEITSEAAQTNLEILQTRSILEPDPNVDRIREQMPEFKVHFEENLKDPILNNLSNLRGQDLDLLYTLWKKNEYILNNWQGTLKNRISDLGVEAAKLSEIKTKWRLTYAELYEFKAPQQLLDRANSIIRDSKKLEREFRKKINELLIFQNQIANYLFKMNSQLIEISKNKEAYLDNIFGSQSVPIWETWGKGADSVKTDLGTVRELSYNLYKNLDYVKSFNYLTIQFLLWLIIALLLYGVKRKSSSWKISEDNYGLKAAVSIAQMPLSTSFIVAFFAMVLFSPERPFGFAQLNVLIIAVPVLRIITKIVGKQLRVFYYLLVSAYILITVTDLVIIGPLLERNFYFLISIFALIVFVYFYKKLENFKSLQVNFYTEAKYLGGIAVIIFSASLILNIAGRFAFSKLLLNGIVDSIYYYLIIRISALTIDGIIALIFRTRENALVRSIAQNAKFIEKRLIGLSHIVLFLFWLRSALKSFTIYDPIYDWFYESITREWIIGSASFSISNILLFLIVLILTWHFAKIIRVFLEADVFSRVKTARGVPGAISMIIRYFIVTAGFFLAVAAAGIELSTLGIVAGGLGVGIGFGLQNIVFNFVSGLILTFERPIQPGDTVEVGPLMGKVTGIGVRSSTVRTFDGSEVIVPNGNLISNEVINWSLSDPHKRLTLPFITEFGSDPSKVIEIMNRIVKESANVLKDPEPLVLFEGYDENGLEFKVLFWVTLGNVLTTKSEVALGIHNALKEEGIKMPIPRREIKIDDVSNANEK